MDGEEEVRGRTWRTGRGEVRSEKEGRERQGNGGEKERMG